MERASVMTVNCFHLSSYPLTYSPTRLREKVANDTTWTKHRRHQDQSETSNTYTFFFLVTPTQILGVKSPSKVWSLEG